MEFKPYQFVVVEDFRTKANGVSPYALVIHTSAFAADELVVMSLDARPSVRKVKTSQCKLAEDIAPFDQFSRFVVAANKRSTAS